MDANGALSRKQALWFADRYQSDVDVRWFEEPVSSDDLDGLRLIRDRAPSGDWRSPPASTATCCPYFEAMLAAGAVDCLAGRRHAL